MRRLSLLVQPLWRALVPARPRPIQQLYPLSTRSFSVSNPRLAAPPRPGKVQILTIEDKINDFVLDENIEAPQVRLKTPDGKLSDPTNLHQLLGSIDRSTSYVMQLANPEHQPFAIVQIVQRADLVKRIKDKEAKERQAKHAQSQKKPKQIELNWAISGNDLQLKMKQMQEFLRKGKKVEVLLANKRRQRRATPEEAESVLQTVKQTAQDVGAIEVAPMEGAILKQATVVVKIP
ncbi:uncharacterized protein Z518_03446 [Rhinocladiella mackenziei CBS 650.93]|uniref:Translation initiation factor 3 C-terminal domain-containing protein n=1 Tax=Rhinocladiella mackenziei CBS 650.93 TaxID=1442369 RepID=A0A0D2IS12_9EURO|nr:uncharacterized protein Z518_03446 [Rhinocladiella mackenziei CBS 650.93]KIX08789.1 hypothetical protein Z518_03446 [Rhinocladiella mackenziei CBS 650.93]